MLVAKLHVSFSGFPGRCSWNDEYSSVSNFRVMLKVEKAHSLQMLEQTWIPHSVITLQTTIWESDVLKIS